MVTQTARQGEHTCCSSSSSMRPFLTMAAAFCDAAGILRDCARVLHICTGRCKARPSAQNPVGAASRQAHVTSRTNQSREKRPHSRCCSAPHTRTHSRVRLFSTACALLLGLPRMLDHSMRPYRPSHPAHAQGSTAMATKKTGGMLGAMRSAQARTRVTEEELLARGTTITPDDVLGLAKPCASMLLPSLRLQPLRKFVTTVSRYSARRSLASIFK